MRKYRLILPLELNPRSTGWRVATLLTLLIIGGLIGLTLSGPAKADDTRTAVVQAQGINPGFITMHSPVLLTDGNIECRAGAWTLGRDHGSIYRLDTWAERLWGSSPSKWIREYPELLHITGNLKYDAITIVPLQFYGNQDHARYRCRAQLVLVSSTGKILKKSGIRQSNARTFYKSMD